MKLKINKIRYAGDLEEERLVLEVIAEIDVGSYIVFQATTAGGGVSNRLGQSFWFPDRVVKPGDFVVLYTKAGSENEKSNKSNTTTYFYYWGLETPVWSDENNVPLLMSIESWDYLDPHEVEGVIKRKPAKGDFTK